LSVSPVRPPVIRLATFYWLLFAAVGAFLPYWALYLKSLGLGAVEIGELVALMAATRVAAPALWGWVADRSGQRMRVVRGCAALAALAFGLLFVRQGYWWIAFVIVAYQVCWSGVLPQLEAVTLSHLAVGALLEHHSSVIAPLVVWVLLFACAAWSLSVPEPRALRSPGRSGTLRAVLARPEAPMFLAACALMQAGHGPYYVFFSIHLEALGHAKGLIGTLWALGVVAEVVLFALMPRLLTRYRLSVLFVACFVLTALRWCLVALLSSSLAALILAQTLHAVSFGLYHAVAIQLVHGLFPGPLQGRGQALYSGLGFGAGGALGSYAAGHAWAFAGPRWTWLGAAALSAVGALLAWWLHLHLRRTMAASVAR
jgi:PPP family 3-phenylpropionic acid transporter